MKRKLIALDLDGTILPTETFLPSRTRDTLRAAQEAGHIILLTSARHWEMTRWVYDAIGIRGPLCLLNGALVTDPYNSAFPTLETTLGADIVHLILEKVLKDVMPRRAYIEYNSRCWTLGDDHNTYYTERLRHSDVHHFSPDTIPYTRASRLQIYTYGKDDIMKIPRIVKDYPGVAALPTQNADDWKCSVLDVNVDKWNGVRYVASVLGIDSRDIYAFGDQWNDFTMVSRAEHGYGILGTAAAEHSKFVTSFSCEEYGVADIIERNILQCTE